MKNRKWIILVLIILLIFIDTDIALAGPGGVIVKGLFKTTIGKIILLLLTIVFAPLIIYMQLREYFEVRKNRKILLKAGRLNRDFNWLNLDKNVKNIFNEVYEAWDDGNLEVASSHISPWYWQNQQKVHLDRWEKQNLKNHCSVKTIRSVKPVYLELSDENDLEGSRIAFIIDAIISDYLVDKDTKKVVEGSRKYGDEKKIWIMEYSNGKWLLDNIDVGESSLAYAKLENMVPLRVLKIVQH
jgi:cell division protein FtsL